MITIVLSRIKTSCEQHVIPLTITAILAIVALSFFAPKTVAVTIAVVVTSVVSIAFYYTEWFGRTPPR